MAEIFIASDDGQEYPVKNGFVTRNGKSAKVEDLIAIGKGQMKSAGNELALDEKKPWYNKNIPIINMPLVSEAGLWEDTKAALSPANFFKSAYPATDIVYEATKDLPIAAQTAIRTPVATAETALNFFPLTSPTNPAGKAVRTGLDIAGKPLNMSAKSLESIAGKTSPQAIKSRLGQKIDAFGKRFAEAISDKPLKTENIRDEISVLKAEINRIGRAPKTQQEARRRGVIQDELAVLLKAKEDLKPVKFDFDKQLLAREAAAREAAFLAGKRLNLDIFKNLASGSEDPSRKFANDSLSAINNARK